MLAALWRTTQLMLILDPSNYLLDVLIDFFQMSSMDELASALL
jgi:hypothetical protein